MSGVELIISVKAVVITLGSVVRVENLSALQHASVFGRKEEPVFHVWSLCLSFYTRPMGNSIGTLVQPIIEQQLYIYIYMFCTVPNDLYLYICS